MRPSKFATVLKPVALIEQLSKKSDALAPQIVFAKNVGCAPPDTCSAARISSSDSEAQITENVQDAGRFVLALQRVSLRFSARQRA